MSKIRRALAGASATVLAFGALAFGAAPASAEDSTFCPEIGSTRLLTANDGYYKAWLYQPSGGNVYVCFGAGYDLRGAFVFRTGLNGSLVPTVTPDVSASDCNDYFHLQDPVDLVVQYEYEWSLTPPLYLCIGAEGTAVGIDIQGANGTLNPSPELWLDGNTRATDYYCWLAVTSCYSYYPVRIL